MAAAAGVAGNTACLGVVARGGHPRRVPQASAMHGPLLPSCYVVRPGPPIHDVHNRRGKVGRHLDVCVWSLPQPTMLYVHIAGSSDTVWDCSTPHQVLVLHSVRCLTLRQPLWRGAQPKDHCSPETQALPRSTRETPARRPRLAAGRTTASLGDRSCWSDNAPSRAPASATRTIRRRPLLQISARASRPSPSTTRGGRSSQQRLREVRRGPGGHRVAPATQPVTRVCLKSRARQ